MAWVAARSGAACLRSPIRARSGVADMVRPLVTRARGPGTQRLCPRPSRPAPPGSPLPTAPSQSPFTLPAIGGDVAGAGSAYLEDSESQVISDIGQVTDFAGQALGVISIIINGCDQHHHQPG